MGKVEIKDLDVMIVEEVVKNKPILSCLKRKTPIKRAEHLHDKLYGFFRGEKMLTNGELPYGLFSKVVGGITEKTGIEFDVSKYKK